MRFHSGLLLLVHHKTTRKHSQPQLFSTVLTVSPTNLVGVELVCGPGRAVLEGMLLPIDTHDCTESRGRLKEDGTQTTVDCCGCAVVTRSMVEKGTADVISS